MGWMFEAATMALQVFVTSGNFIPTHFIRFIVSGEKYSPRKCSVSNCTKRSCALKECYGLQCITPLFCTKGQMTCKFYLFPLRFCSCFDIRDIVAFT